MRKKIASLQEKYRRHLEKGKGSQVSFGVVEEERQDRRRGLVDIMPSSDMEFPEKVSSANLDGMG